MPHISELPAKTQNITMDKLVFFHELPALLNYSRVYISYITNPSAAGRNEALYRRQNFPQPALTLSGGYRLWHVDDLVQWAESHTTRKREERRDAYLPLIHNADLIRELLGLSPRTIR